MRLNLQVNKFSLVKADELIVDSKREQFRTKVFKRKEEAQMVESMN